MNKLRGLRDIPSFMRPGRSGQMRSQYEYEVLNELAQLGREKVRLNGEKKKWQERIQQIDARLREIGEVEGSLRRQMAAKEETAPDVQDAKQVAGEEGREVVIKY